MKASTTKPSARGIELACLLFPAWGFRRRTRPNIFLDGLLPLFRRQTFGGFKPSFMHCMEQFLVDRRHIEAEDRIDAAVGAKCCLVIIDPFDNLLEREFVETIEAAADLRFCERRSVAAALLVERGEICFCRHKAAVQSVQ